jgi:hypothetical protein
VERHAETGHLDRRAGVELVLETRGRQERAEAAAELFPQLVRGPQEHTGAVQLAEDRVVRQAKPGEGVLPHALQAGDQAGTGLRIGGQARNPALHMHPVGVFLLHDLPCPLAQRLVERVHGRFEQGGQRGVHHQVRGHEVAPGLEWPIQAGHRMGRPTLPALLLHGGRIAGLGEAPQERVEGAGVAELVLGHGGRRHGRLEQRRAGAPLRVAAAQHVLVVGQRGQQAEHGLAQTRLERVDHGQVGPFGRGRRHGRDRALQRLPVRCRLEQARVGHLVAHEAITVRIESRGATIISIHGCSS